MRLVNKSYSKHGPGHAKLVPEEGEDLNLETGYVAVDSI